MKLNKAKLAKYMKADMRRTIKEFTEEADSRLEELRKCFPACIDEVEEMIGKLNTAYNYAELDGNLKAMERAGGLRTIYNILLEHGN